MHEEYLDSDIQRDAQSWVYATFWQRVGASLLDALIFVPLIAINFYNYAELHSFSLFIGTFIISAMYKPYMEHSYGATIGKMIVGIEVVDESGDWMNIHQAIARYLPWIFSHIFSFYAAYSVFTHPDLDQVEGWMEFVMLQEQLTPSWMNSLIGMIMMVSILLMFSNERNQAGHDMIARTFVIKKP